MGRAGAPISVLVVEDEILISNLVADVLSASGFVVHEVTTADEALRYINSDADIDILFTDVNLPGGMNGAELATRARHCGRKCRSSMLQGVTSFPKLPRWCRARSSWRSLMIPTMSARY